MTGVSLVERDDPTHRREAELYRVLGEFSWALVVKGTPQMKQFAWFALRSFLSDVSSPSSRALGVSMNAL